MIYLERHTNAANTGGSFNIWERGAGTLSAQIIGTNSIASGTFSIAGGKDATASGNNVSICLGFGALASGETSIALGLSSIATGISSVAIAGGNASAQGAVAIGANSQALGANSFSLGGIAFNTGAFAAIGGEANQPNSIAIGAGCAAEAIGSVAIGFFATANGLRSVSIGNQNVADEIGTFATGNGSIANKYGANTQSSGGINNNGDCQLEQFQLWGVTPDNAAYRLSLDGTTRQWQISRYSIQLIKMDIVGKVFLSDADYYTESLTFNINCDSAGVITTPFLQSDFLDTAGSGTLWAVNINVDNTNHQVYVEVKGDPTNPTLWNARIRSTILIPQ